MDLDFHFKHPTTILISGPTQCGKTRFVRRILEQRLIDPFPTRIIWVYSEWQGDYDVLRDLYPTIEFIHGWSDSIYESIERDEINLLVLDDQMTAAAESTTLADAFTKGSHHRNLTVLFLVQNVYNKGKSMRTMSLNSHYNVLFNNKRDASQAETLARQMCPRDSRWLVDAIADAHSQPYGYIALDTHPTTSRDLSVLTNVFPGEALAVYSKYKSPRH